MLGDSSKRRVRVFGWCGRIGGVRGLARLGRRGGGQRDGMHSDCVYGHGSEMGGKRVRLVVLDARLGECECQGVGGMGGGDELFEKVHDDGALVQSTGRRVIVEPQRGNQALGGEIEEFLWLLVGIDFVCQRRTVFETYSGPRQDGLDVQY